MNSFKYLLAVLVAVLMLPSVEAATEAQAKLITDEFDRNHTMWLAEMQLAKKTGVVDQVAKKRPDVGDYANRLKVLISRDLAKEWTLNYGAWLLENDSELKPESQRALLGAAEKHHTLSPSLGRFCMALIYLNQGSELPRAGQPPVRSRGMNFLKTVKKNNPAPKVQGLASLSLSMMLASLGDDPRVMKERIDNLREAIIKSAEQRVGNLTVAKIAQDELYKIKNLSKGSVAPPVAGVDSGLRPMQLAEFKGKVVVLVFWSSWDAEAGRMLEMLRRSVQAQAGKPIVVLGVNRDSVTNLRSLEADGLVTWRNFTDPKEEIAKTYRIGSWPYCLVLDQKGVISYHGNVGSFADAVANSLLVPQK